MRAALLAFLIFISSPLVDACINYSGSYRELGEVEYDRVDIIQRDCARITFRIYVGKHYAEQIILTNGESAAHTTEGLRIWELQMMGKSGQKRLDKLMVLQPNRNIVETNKITFPDGRIEENSTLWKRL